MRINFGTIFQKYSKDNTMGGLVNIPRDSTLWPTSWKVVQYKTYERFNKLELPKPVYRTFGHADLIKRRSANEKDFGSLDKYGVMTYTKISLQSISNILYFSCGEVRKFANGSKPRRAQASAGARYPIEAYVLNFEEGELKKKCYHYNIKSHTLEELWDIPITSRKDIQKYFGSTGTSSSAAIILTGIPRRTTMKYGERGYKYMYLEAGAILGNIEYNCLHEGLQSVIRGTTQDSAIETLLDLDGEAETVILGILIG